MLFANYSDFRSAVLRLIDGDDASGSIHTDTLDLLIALGESRVYHGDEMVPGLRTRDMDGPLAGDVTDNRFTLPSDCLEVTRVQFDGRTLDYLPTAELLDRLDAGGGGDARYYTQQGDTLIFYPEASGTLAGRYHARPFDIAGGLNPAFNRYPECFLFGALSEASPFIGEDARLPMWKQLWAGWMQKAHTTERNAATNGGRLTIRTR